MYIYIYIHTHTYIPIHIYRTCFEQVKNKNYICTHVPAAIRRASHTSKKDL